MTLDIGRTLHRAHVTMLHQQVQELVIMIECQPTNTSHLVAKENIIILQNKKLIPKLQELVVVPAMIHILKENNKTGHPRKEVGNGQQPVTLKGDTTQRRHP